MKFQIMWKNELVADVEVFPDTDEVKLQKHKGFPNFLDNRVDRRRIYEFIKSRCVEENRSDIREILNQLGIQEYDPWKMVRVTHGVDWDDFYWLRFEGEDFRWEDVRVRE